MNPFEYAIAQTPASAVDLLGENGRYLAGGIDLLGEMKEYIATPSRLVNVKKLPASRKIEKDSKGAWHLGTNVTVAEIAAHPELAKAFSGLVSAASEVGSPQIRNVATLGGNLAQHSRCWYYRQRDLACLKRGGSTCYGREGENKYLSIFSGNPCVSPVVSNLSIALAALDAKAIVWRQGTEVPLAIPDLYQDAWNNPLAHNSLQPGDLIVRVEIPPTMSRSAYLQQSEKSSFDWALVSCAAAAKIDHGRASDVRVFLGAVAPVPFQVADAAKSLEGQMITEQSVTTVADAMLSRAQPLLHNGYKIPIAHALIRRTLLKLLA